MTHVTDSACDAVETPDFAEVAAGLAPGIYDARYLNPPSGSDCTHLLVWANGRLGWCDAAGPARG